MNFQHLICLMILLAGMYVAPLGVTGLGFDGMPGDLGDTRFNQYIFEHGHRFLSGKESSFWNAPFFYPESEAITYSDNLLGTLPLYSFLRLLGADSELSIQIWMFVIFILNFVCCWYALKKFTSDPLAAAFGAYLFAFSLPVMAQINHIQLLPRFFIPLVFWFLYQFLQTRRPLWLIWSLLCLLGQFYGSMYLGFMLSLSVGSFLIFYMMFNYRSFLLNLTLQRGKLLTIAGAAISSLVILLPVALPYLRRSRSLGYRSFEEIEPLIPRWSSYLNPAYGSFFWEDLSGFSSHLTAPWEHQLFPGMLALVSVVGLMVLVVLKSKWELKNLVLISLSTLLVLIVLTLKIRGFTMYEAVLKIPGFGSMRAVGRIILVQLFFFSLLLAVAIKMLLPLLKRNRYMVFGLLSVILIADNFVTPDGLLKFSKEESQNRIRPILTKIEQSILPDTHKVIAYMPEDERDATLVQLDGMLAAQKIGLPSVNGYSSTSPYGFSNFWSNYTEEALQEWLSIQNVSTLRDSILVIK